jgi:outer membrane protein TolC
VLASRAAYLPRVNAFADYQWHDDRMFGYYGNGYLAGIQASWDLFKGFQHRYKTATQRLERDQLLQQLDHQKEEARAEIRRTRRQLEDADFQIRQQEVAAAQAREALRVLRDRFEQGLATTTDLLMAQTQYSQQQLAMAKAVFLRHSAQAYLHFLTAQQP